MAFRIGPSEIRRLENLFGVPAKSMGTNYRFELLSQENGRRLALELYPDIPIGRKRGTLVSVYTDAAHLQLHFCSGLIISDDLGEATFVGEHRGRLSGLIVEKGAGCTLFANVDRSILSGDFTQLAPEVMMSGVALSLTEEVLEKRPAHRRKTTSRKRKVAVRS
jgi:hypothetical protein